MTREASEYFRDAPQSPLATIPADRHARWKLIREMIRQWFPADLSRLKLPPGMGPITTPPTTSPAVQEWYKIVCEAPGIWCRQDHLFGVRGDWRRGEYLTIAIENQACAYWGIPLGELGGDDPPVFVDRDEGWVQECTTTSEFAIRWLAGSLKYSRHNRCWANYAVSETGRQIVVENIPRLELAISDDPTSTTRFYGTRDILVEVEGNEGITWLFASARAREPFEKLKELFDNAGIAFDTSSDEWPEGWVSASSDLE